MKIKFIYLLIISYAISLTAQAQSTNNFMQKQEVRNFINSMVKNHGFKQPELMITMRDIVPQPSIIELMERPFEKKNWDVYKQLFLTQQRLQEGLEFWQANYKALAKAEKIYGVPANIIVAILGVETAYGKHQGNYRVIDALATLAFNYNKRTRFFTKELEEYLLLCRETGVKPNSYRGSYAGAIGKPQFMPSSYRYYAANFDGNPKKDLVNDDNAVIASVANYFHRHGWKMNQGVAQPAKIINSTAAANINTKNKIAMYNLNFLAKSGVYPVTAANHQPQKAGLIELITDTGPEYWLTYPNFYVITRYNTSPQYALAVYLLSNQLQKQWIAILRNNKQFAYA